MMIEIDLDEKNNSVIFPVKLGGELESNEFDDEMVSGKKMHSKILLDWIDNGIDN